MSAINLATLPLAFFGLLLVGFGLLYLLRTDAVFAFYSRINTGWARYFGFFGAISPSWTRLIGWEHIVVGILALVGAFT